VFFLIISVHLLRIFTNSSIFFAFSSINQGFAGNTFGVTRKLGEGDELDTMFCLATQHVVEARAIRKNSDDGARSPLIRCYSNLLCVSCDQHFPEIVPGSEIHVPKKI
jgi:hypothetical protein